MQASPNTVTVIKSQKMALVRHVAYMGEMWNSYKILFGKPEQKTPLERPRRKCEDNNRIDLRDTGGKLWTGFIWHRIGTSSGLLCTT